jgi:hypothetical protein
MQPFTPNCRLSKNKAVVRKSNNTLKLKLN